MRLARIGAIVAACVLAAASAQAAERAVVCAKEGNGQSYRIEATVITGQELNSATRSINYTPYSKYVVIFWQQNQASVIELDLPYLGVFDADGKDQQGRRWKVSTNSICM